MSEPRQPDHHPTYMVAKGECWASCRCGWRTDSSINGNQVWAQLEFGKHLVAARLEVSA